MINKYLMRAYKASSPSGFIYWTSFDAPDFMATNSGYPLSELSNVVVRSITQVPRVERIVVIGPTSDGYM
jgi:hypothetical protein